MRKFVTFAFVLSILVLPVNALVNGNGNNASKGTPGLNIVSLQNVLWD